MNLCCGPSAAWGSLLLQPYLGTVDQHSPDFEVLGLPASPAGSPPIIPLPADAMPVPQSDLAVPVRAPLVSSSRKPSSTGTKAF